MRAVACALSLATVALALPCDAQERPLPAAGPFLEQVRTRLQSDQARQSGYTYTETRRELRLDKSGRTTKEKLQVFESYPGLPGQDRWERLVVENGRPVPASKLEKQDRERQKKAQEYVRRLEKEPDKVKREHAREREEYFREMAEAVNAVFLVYEIRMLGRESIEGHDAIVLSLTPRPDAKPPTRDGRIMKHFTARAWISEAEHELVRLDVEAIDTVSFGFGLLARVHKGARASFTRRKVNGEAWLPASASYTASARVGLVKVLRVGGTSEYSNYRKFTVDTTTTYTTQ